MTEHALNQVHTAIEQRLIDGVPSLAGVEAALRSDREYQSNEFPLAIVQIAETVGPVTDGPSRGKAKKRMLTVAIQIAQQCDPDGKDTALGRFQAEVEAALDGDPPILRGMKNWFHAQTTPSVGSPQSGIVERTLTYTCSILTPPGRSDIIL